MKRMAERHNLAKDFTKLEKSAFNLSLGVRAAIFVVAPIVIALIIHESYLLYTTLGAFLLAMTEGQPSTLSGRILAVACFTEGTAVGLGTFVATVGGAFLPILLGFGLFVTLIARGTPKLASLGTFTAIAFAFGVGLPGASSEAAGIRASFLLLGGLWALLGVELHRFVVRRKKGSLAATLPISQAISSSEALRNALAVAVACAIGFMIGSALGFPRDYWIVATIIFAVRPRISLTTSFTALLGAGTVVGALIAAAITITMGNDAYLLAALLLVLGISLFSSRGVNYGLSQIFITSFIIVLLNIAFPGEWYLAFYRIVDVGIGVGISLVLVKLLGVFKKTSTWL